MTPWWCRTFGHSYRHRATSVVTSSAWAEANRRTTVLLCSRCGDIPAPPVAPGLCDERGPRAFGKQVPLSCDLLHGHEGMHRHPQGGHWSTGASAD